MNDRTTTAALCDRNAGFVDCFADLPRLTSARTLVRSAALGTLSAMAQATGQIDGALSRPRVQILNLHHVFRDEEEDFRALLRYLMKHHRVISYGEAVSRVVSGKIDAPYLAFTFDDGLRNCLRAARVLEEWNIGACMFVCSAIVGERDPARLQEFCSHRLGMPLMEFLSWKDLEQLRGAGHEVGSHSATHTVLSGLSAAQLDDEIGGSYSELRARLGEARHFAWPNGRFEHSGPAIPRKVYAAGFVSCASAERGCHVAEAGLTPEKVCIRRDQIVAAWPVRHSLYFLARSSRAASAANNHWPEGWEQEESVGR